MRIVHVAQPVEAGVPRVVVDLVQDQQSRGWEVSVACPPKGWLPRAAEGAGAVVHPWPSAREPGLQLWSEVRSLAQIVTEVNPAVVHLHSAKAGLAGRLALRGARPTVFQPHAWSFHAVGGALAAASATWERWAARWTNLIVAVSQDEADLGLAHGVRAPTFVAPNGVDVGIFVPGDRAHARRLLGLGPEPLAVCVGRLTRQKGQDLLLAAWPQVRAQVPGAQLVLVGDGPDRSVLQEKHVRGVRMVGSSSDPSRWYAAADVVVAPSRWEGMALVVLEAMASGRSVITSDVAGAREAVGTEAGEVVPVADTAALVSPLVRRLSDPYLSAREGRAGRERAIQHFDVRRAAARTGDAVQRLAEG
jgi:glycosyltransferase involved in cell wall biosynthesis